MPLGTARSVEGVTTTAGCSGPRAITPASPAPPRRQLVVDDAPRRPSPLIERDDAAGGQLGHVGHALDVDAAHVRAEDDVGQCARAGCPARGARSSRTSSPAPARWPEARLSARSASTTRPPRAVLIRYEPGRILARVVAVDQAPGLRGQGQVQAHDVGRGEQLVEAEPADAVAGLEVVAGRRPGRRRRRASRRPGRGSPRRGRSGPGRPGPASCPGAAGPASGPSPRRGSSGSCSRRCGSGASSSANACSATLSWFVPGVITTGIFRAVAAATSIAS